jgi:hypothetical protein
MQALNGIGPGPHQCFTLIAYGTSSCIMTFSDSDCTQYTCRAQLGAAAHGVLVPLRGSGHGMLSNGVTASGVYGLW